jgi:hypothetical protein
VRGDGFRLSILVLWLNSITPIMDLGLGSELGLSLCPFSLGFELGLRFMSLLTRIRTRTRPEVYVPSHRVLTHNINKAHQHHRPKVNGPPVLSGLCMLGHNYSLLLALETMHFSNLLYPGMLPDL